MSEKVYTYAEVLEELEVEPSDVVYEYVPGKGMDDMIELKDFKYRKYNLLGQELVWLFERREYTKGWSRGKRRKINIRLQRFFKNWKRRLKNDEVKG